MKQGCLAEDTSNPSPPLTYIPEACLIWMAQLHPQSCSSAPTGGVPLQMLCTILFVSAGARKYHGTSFSLEGHTCPSLLRGKFPVGPQNDKTSTCLLPTGMSCITLLSRPDNKHRHYQWKVKKTCRSSAQPRCQQLLVEQEPCFDYSVLQDENRKWKEICSTDSETMQMSSGM